jgi:hypothetical protein
LLKGVNPLRAILLSITLVRRFFPGTLALLALSALIMVGLNVLWQSLVGNLPGLLLAMVGNAYIGSGLIAARMVFYQDRLASAVQETATSEERKG